MEKQTTNPLSTRERDVPGVGLSWDEDDLDLMEAEANDRRSRQRFVEPGSEAETTRERTGMVPHLTTAELSLVGPDAVETTDGPDSDSDGDDEMLEVIQTPDSDTPGDVGNVSFLEPSPLSSMADEEEGGDGDFLDDELVEGASFGDLASPDAVSGTDPLVDLADDLEFEPTSDEDDEPPLFEVDAGGDALDRYGKAERLAYETILLTGLDREAAWPVLLDIFLESPWPRTRRSIEQLVAAGATWQTLTLAAQVRRVWLDHPEFVQAYPKFFGTDMRWRCSESVFTNLSWPRAALLAEAWSGYPDVAEVERTLEVLFDQWRCDEFLRRRFANFVNFLSYVVEQASGAFDEWLENFLGMGKWWDDPIGRLEEPDCWSEARDELMHYGVDLPRTRRGNRCRFVGNKYDK